MKNANTTTPDRLKTWTKSALENSKGHLEVKIEDYLAEGMISDAAIWADRLADINDELETR